jgi:hypothetical protein
MPLLQFIVLTVRRMIALTNGRTMQRRAGFHCHSCQAWWMTREDVCSSASFGIGSYFMHHHSPIVSDGGRNGDNEQVNSRSGSRDA